MRLTHVHVACGKIAYEYALYVSDQDPNAGDSHVARSSTVTAEKNEKTNGKNNVAGRAAFAHAPVLQGGSVAEWLACWTQAQKGPGSNRSRDAVG